MAAYLEAFIHELVRDVSFIAKAVEDIARAKRMTQIACEQVCPRIVCIRYSPVIGAQVCTKYEGHLCLRF